MVINGMFGTEIMRKVNENIAYPYQFPNTAHQSNIFSFGDKVTVGKKIILKKNRKLGVLLQDGVNEFELAAIMDINNRTFPNSIESFSVNDLTIKTKFGLTLIPTGKTNNINLDELHVIDPLSFSKPEQVLFKSAEIVKYDNLQKQYIIDECLQRIRLAYGRKVENVVKLMLDYN